MKTKFNAKSLSRKEMLKFFAGDYTEMQNGGGNRTGGGNGGGTNSGIGNGTVTHCGKVNPVTGIIIECRKLH